MQKISENVVQNQKLNCKYKEEGIACASENKTI